MKCSNKIETKIILIFLLHKTSVPYTMDYITDYIHNIPNTISYRIYDELLYKTHLYIVNNMNQNYIYPNDYINYVYDDIYDDDELTSLQYFNIMSFLDEIS